MIQLLSNFSLLLCVKKKRVPCVVGDLGLQNILSEFDSEKAPHVSGFVHN